MYYIEISVDGELFEIELTSDYVYAKCPKCGQRIGMYPRGLDEELRQDDRSVLDCCPNCRETPEEGRARLLKWAVKEFERKHGYTISEEELLERAAKIHAEMEEAIERKAKDAANLPDRWERKVQIIRPK